MQKSYCIVKSVLAVNYDCITETLT